MIYVATVAFFGFFYYFLLFKLDDELPFLLYYSIWARLEFTPINGLYSIKRSEPASGRKA